MANRTQILADIRKEYGNMLNISDLTKALGYKDRRAAVKFMVGIPAVNMGKEKKYLAIDIAKRISDNAITE